MFLSSPAGERQREGVMGKVKTLQHHRDGRRASLSIEQRDELGFDHAAENISAGNESDQLAVAYHGNPYDVVGRHLGDHHLDLVVLFDTNRRTAHDLQSL